MTGMRVGGGGRRPVAEWRPVTAARRIGSAPHALTVTGTILAVASFAQASVQAVALAGARGSTAHASTSSLALYAVSLFLRPLAAAVFITTASVLSLAAFGVVTAGNATSGMVTAGLVTAGGAAAQVIAVYRLGAAGPGDSPGAAEHADWRARYLSLGLAAPFLVLALVSQGGMAA